MERMRAFRRTAEVEAQLNALPQFVTATDGAKRA